MRLPTSTLRLLSESFQSLSCFTSARSVLEYREVLPVSNLRLVELFRSFQGLRQFEGGNCVVRLKLQCFAVSAQRGFVISGLVVVVANLYIFHRAQRIPLVQFHHFVCDVTAIRVRQSVASRS